MDVRTVKVTDLLRFAGGVESGISARQAKHEDRSGLPSKFTPRRLDRAEPNVVPPRTRSVSLVVANSARTGLAVYQSGQWAADRAEARSTPSATWQMGRGPSHWHEPRSKLRAAADHDFTHRNRGKRTTSWYVVIRGRGDRDRQLRPTSDELAVDTGAASLARKLGARRRGRGTATVDDEPAGARRHRGCHAGHPGRLRPSAGCRPCRLVHGACGRRCGRGIVPAHAFEPNATRAHGLHIKDAPAGLD